ncbi:MAG: tyrosinase family protein [Cyclobacteriaceae bacterium]
MADKIIQHPVWSDITDMISDFSVEQMKPQGLDLRDFGQVSAMAHKIYYYLAYKLMPLGVPWSDEKIQTFNNWLIDGCPKDEAHREQLKSEQNEKISQSGLRVRKDIHDLTDDEEKLLIKAFKGLMDRDPKSASEYDPNDKSYFSIAGTHWYPAPTFCQHHIYNYLPWHRFYLIQFEDALRSVPGCEEVTLPYWNIEESETIPEFFNKDPFKNYTFPIDVYPDYYKPPVNMGKAGTVTERNKTLGFFAQIKSNINTAMSATTWNHYNGISNYQYNSSQSIIRAHDLGHNGSGPAMADQDIASFDPIFWFFHCNWDRLWWDWQKSRNATDLDGFKKTLSEDDDQRWLTDPQMSISDPFGKHNYESIDSHELGITYEEPQSSGGPKLMASNMPLAMAPTWREHNRGQSNKSSFKLSQNNIGQVSLRVKDINRIKIPGSFWVVLHLDGEEIGRDAFFQSTFSGNCENCVAQAHVHFDFIFDLDLLTDEDGNSKEVKVEIVNAVTGEKHDFDKIGEPTINIRLLH